MRIEAEFVLFQELVIYSMNQEICNGLNTEWSDGNSFCLLAAKVDKTFQKSHFQKPDWRFLPKDSYL